MAKFEANIIIIGRKKVVCEAENANAANEIFMKMATEYDDLLPGNPDIDDFEFEPVEHADTQEVPE